MRRGASHGSSSIALQHATPPIACSPRRSLASWEDRRWTPGSLRTGQQFWSRSFYRPSLCVIFIDSVFFYFFQLVICQRLYVAFIEWRKWNTAGTSSDRAAFIKDALIKNVGPCIDDATLIWVWNIRSFGLLQTEPELAVNLAVTLLVVIVRVVQLGHVLSPFSHLILTLKLALPFLVRLSIVITIILGFGAMAAVRLVRRSVRDHVCPLSRAHW